MRTQGTIRRARRASAMVAMAAALGGCGDASGPEPPDLTGRWVGQVVEELSTVDLDFRLEANDRGAITGTVTLREEEMSLSGEVIGLHEHPGVSLVIGLALQGARANVTYSGSLFGPDQIRGRIRFSVEGTLPLDLDRVGG